MSLHVQLDLLLLREPFHISGYTFTEVPVLKVRLSASGLSGRGEAAGVYYLHDRPQAMLATLEEARPQIEAGITRHALRDLLPPGGARNAVDCALWELDAARAGCAEWQLAGIGRPVPKTCTMTLGAMSPQAMAEGARGFSAAKALKLKLTGETAIDIERVKAVRAARPDVWLCVDANQGFTPATIAPLLPVLLDCSVSLLEQPFARGREADMKNIEFPLPTAADESCLSLAELEKVGGLFDIVNIKLDKCGGLTEGLMVAEAARQMGLGVMVGNMGGTSLAMAPGFILGQLCDVVDLDGPISITNDCTPSASYAGGEISCAPDVWGGREASVH